MPEPVLRGDPPVPAASLDEGTAEGAAERSELAERADLAELEELDEQLISQLLRRTRCARAYQLNRRAANLPASSLCQENAMLSQYTSRLGRPGAEIALLILALSHPPGAGRQGREADRQ
ncbi:hypothetical protein ACFZB9_24665 [Kitasatospora sp. NPDC008050]|uniref:hypothetical protein n=1 Tax=Kitasatospora sp. NPDC008050 TaxID=3364021 RepID=UPI0036E6ECAC